MKLRQLFALLLLFLLCVATIGCSRTADNENATVAEPSSKDHEESRLAIPLPREYDAIIRNLIAAYPWNDDGEAVVPENPELSYLYRQSAALSDIGFSLMDLDNNGQEELIISDIHKSFIYDVYTISNGNATHLFDSGERYRYYLFENGYLEYQWSGGAAVSGQDFYKLDNGALCFVERIVLDNYHALDLGMISDISEANHHDYYFRSESVQAEDYQLISCDEATNAIEDHRNANKPLMIEYVLLSEY